MKKGLTEIVFILDRSGSMSGLEQDTIGGFNSMIQKQKQEEGEALVSTVLFNNQSSVIHDRVKVQNVAPMTCNEYFVGGSTALLDAIGGAIHHIGNVHKYAREEDIPEHTLFVITTDGMENASHLYSSDKVKTMIQRQKEKYGWEFLFLGANIDAVETAASFGISQDRAVNYNCDSKGTALNYRVLSDTICAVRASRPISADWKRDIDADYAMRGKKKGAYAPFLCMRGSSCTTAMPAATHISSVKASTRTDATAAAASEAPAAISAVMRLVNMGTNTATPKGAARSRNRPYVPVPAPAFSAGMPLRATFINIVPLAPRPKPNIPRDRARMSMEALSVNSSISPQPMPVNSREKVSTSFGSRLSARGPSNNAPRAMPMYIMEME